MRISVLILVSLAANLMLAALWFHKSRGAAATSADGAAGAQNSTDANATGLAATAKNSSGAAIESSTVTVAGKFSWANLASPDLKEYIRKLRAANCPEPTVQDLILSEVNRQFAAKTRDFFNGQEIIAQNTYWKPYQRRQQDPEQAKKNQERYKAYESAQKEKTALIVELFGFDVEKQRMKDEGYDQQDNFNYATGDLSFLPESKREAVGKYLETMQEKLQVLYADMAGGWGPEKRAKQKELEAERLVGLAQFLTPQEVLEYDLRNSNNAQQISSDLHGVDLTRAQYEALFDLHKKYGDSIYNYGDANNDEEARKKIEQNQKALKAEVSAALGEQKFAELDRAQDYQYQQLKSLAKRNDLPADTAPKIYDFKQAAEKAVEALKANQDLTTEARQAALTQIRVETEQSVSATLGDKIFKRYQSNNGWWINQLGPAPKK